VPAVQFRHAVAVALGKDIPDLLVGAMMVLGRATMIRIHALITIDI
jgi:hypothetical protein